MLGFTQTKVHCYGARAVRFSVSLTIKCMFINNQQQMIKPTHIDLNPDELCYYPFITSVHRCDGNSYTIESQFNRICVSTKI